MEKMFEKMKNEIDNADRSFCVIFTHGPEDKLKVSTYSTNLPKHMADALTIFFKEKAVAYCNFGRQCLRREYAGETH